MAAADERRIQELGRLIAKASEAPWWRPRSLDDRLLAWVVGHPGLRTRLFRFVDVFPATQDPDDVARHLQQYLSGATLPPGAGSAVRRADQLPALTARLARSQIRHLARRFIAAEFSDDASTDAVVERIGELWQSGSAATVDLLGEKTLTAVEADAYSRRVLRLLDALSSRAPKWPPNSALDRDRWGVVPRVNVSVKPTALSPKFDPLEGDDAVNDAFGRLSGIIEAANTLGATVHLDIEHDEVHEITYQLLQRAAQAYPDANLGCVVQAYRLDAADTLAQLAEFAAATMRTPLQIRLVKGAYWDQEQVAAAARGWPAPVHASKEATDANFERCARYLMEHAGPIRPLVGSHNIRSLAAALAAAEQAGLGPTDIELQLLYGMAPALRPALVRLGYRTRVYTPVGDLETGMAYLVRRLLENTSNDSFVRRREVDGAALDELLRAPAEQVVAAAAPVPPRIGPAPRPVSESGSGSGPGSRSGSADTAPTDLEQPFSNEPPAELRRTGPRRVLLDAVSAVERGLGFEAPVLVGGKPLPSAEPLVSVNPGRPQQVVCRAGRATAAHVDEAMGLAEAAAPAWAGRSPDDRARVLLRTAAELRTDRPLLAALIAVEAGKPLPEADADVCEAIDFCEYYARQAMVLARGAPVLQAPGESNRHIYQPRGVGVVISPWNFPLAIPTGMVAASLVTGNTVLFKPAEQTPGIASRLVAAFHRAGVPPDVLAFLPGLGEEAGAAAVADPRTTFVAFVGSRDVGRGIMAEAARAKAGQRQLPRVIAELGGKNPVVMDEDADLDVAVPAVITSAFGYAGQKCSAASRLVVPRRRLDETVERLVGATRLVAVGQATDLRTVVGPLIEEDARQRLRRYQKLARGSAEVLIERDDVPEDGWFVGPQVVLVDDPTSPLVREEIFGPLLCVQPADDFDEALALANDTDYALTAGVFSRSPANIRRAATELRAGNVYINRGTTGALVGRQPFGGYGMSGGGSKAGGAHYLLHFVDPRVITENTMRQGFVPDSSDDTTADGAISGPDAAVVPERSRRAR